MFPTKAADPGTAAGTTSVVEIANAVFDIDSPCARSWQMPRRDTVDAREPILDSL
jgi:hypothetical protein